MLVSINVALIASYCHEGRVALKKIPAISAVFTFLYAIAGISLSGYQFSVPLLEPFYRIAQLFVGESAWVDTILDKSIPQESPNTLALVFNLARLTALIATVSGVLALIKKLLDGFKARVYGESGHVVLCGLGEAGAELAKKWQKVHASDRNRRGNRLVIIERKPLNPNIDTARDLGFGVIVGDVFDPLVREKARLDKAATIVMLLPDDKRNVELALEIRAWITKRRLDDAVGSSSAVTDQEKAVRLLIHVDDTGLARRLQDHSRAGAETYTDTQFFDFYETSARSLFQQYPMESSASLLDTGSVHLAIYGFGKMGEAILREAVRLGILPDGKTLHISVFDRCAIDDNFQAGFWQANPGLEGLVNVKRGYQPIKVKIDFYRLKDARRGIDHQLLRDAADGAGGVAATQHTVCFDEDEVTASFALALRDALRELSPELLESHLSWDAPIFARLKRRHGLARLFLEGVSEPRENSDLSDTPDTLYAFGMLDDLVDPEKLLDNRRDDLAKILHEEGYRPQRGQDNPVKNIWRKQTKVPWRFLPLHYKGSNRAQADHIYIKLRSLGCGIHTPSRPFNPSSTAVQEYSKTQLGELWKVFLTELPSAPAGAEPAYKTWLDHLARVEHDRWSVYHFLENWHYADKRVDAARTHDNLTAWEELDDATKAYDAEHVNKLPDFVYLLEQARGNRNAARMICREVRVGIVGHLPERLEVSYPWLTSSRDPSGTLPSGHGLARKAKSLILSVASQILEQASNENYDMPLKMVLVSAAAEGADRIIAEALIDEPCISPEFELILPLPWEIYYMTFHKEYESRKASVDQFYKLVQHARSTMQLPLRFGPLSALGYEDSENDEDKGRDDPHHKQLQLANAYMAQHCDYLIAAWDGREIGANPAELNDEELLQRMKALPDGNKQSPYTKVAKPGGTWEAVRWWLLPDTIPETMRWTSRQPQAQLYARRAREKYLKCVGAMVAPDNDK